MKTSRILTLLALAFALPASVFAAKGSATVAAVAGQARSSVGNAVPASVEVGALLQEGALIETGLDSGLELTLSNGGKLVLAPNSRVRITSLEQSDKPGVYSFEVVLLRGGIRGDASKSSPGATFSVRTSVGTTNVAGSVFAVDFVPTSVTTGNMNVVVVSGQASVSVPSAMQPVVVPAGSQIQVGQGAAGAGADSTVTPETLANIKAVLSGEGAKKVTRPAGTPGVKTKREVAPVAPLPDTSVFLPDTSVFLVSPNGEGNAY